MAYGGPVVSGDIRLALYEGFKESLDSGYEVLKSSCEGHEHIAERRTKYCVEFNVIYWAKNPALRIFDVKISRRENIYNASLTV